MEERKLYSNKGEDLYAEAQESTTVRLHENLDIILRSFD